MVRNPSANAGDKGLNSGLGGSQMPVQLSLCNTTTEAACLYY